MKNLKNTIFEFKNKKGGQVDRHRVDMLDVLDLSSMIYYCIGIRKTILSKSGIGYIL